MALNLRIFERIGTYLGFGNNEADRDAQDKSTEHEGTHYGHNTDDLKGEGSSPDKRIDNYTQDGDHGSRDWQNSKYVSIGSDLKYQDSSEKSGPSNYADSDQHRENSGPLPSELNHDSSDYYDEGHNTWENDGGDLHAVLAGLPDTGAMLDAAISHLDSDIPCDFGSLDVTPFDDHGGSTGMT
jgi:hypothetical protein